MEISWFKAAEAGDDKLIAKLLHEHPSLITAVNSYYKRTALHLAALHGHENVVTLLLAAHPALVDAKDEFGTLALHFAASGGHVKIVAQLLAASPESIDTAERVELKTPLHNAAAGGHESVVALLLAARPALATQADRNGRTALHDAIRGGHEKVFHQLLAACPELIDTRDKEGSTVLDRAVHAHMVTQILAVRPEMIAAVADCGYNPLHNAALYEHEIVAEKLFAIKPDLIFGITMEGNTALHLCVRHHRTKQFVANVWRMNPQALHAVNARDQTPFDIAVVKINIPLIELFEGSLSLDELERAFAHKPHIYQGRCGALLRVQCESLWDSLTQDVTPIVLEYLGYNPNKCRPHKRTQSDEDEIVFLWSLHDC